MHVVRRVAAVVVILVVVGAPWALAAQTYTDGHGRDHGQHVSRDGSVGLLDYLWGLVRGFGMKAGSQVVPLEACSNRDPFCGGEPLGGSQAQESDAGCGIDPLGHCSPGH